MRNRSLSHAGVHILVGKGKTQLATRSLPYFSLDMGVRSYGECLFFMWVHHHLRSSSAVMFCGVALNWRRKVQFWCEGVGGGGKFVRLSLGGTSVR